MQTIDSTFEKRGVPEVGSITTTWTVNENPRSNEIGETVNATVARPRGSVSIGGSWASAMGSSRNVISHEEEVWNASRGDARITNGAFG